MRILALDTATTACSVALWSDGAVRARRFAAMERGQAEALVPMLEEVRAEAGFDYAELDLLAVTVGPGAFTGLRIGLATARGLALAAALPCVGVTTLEAVAEGVGDDEWADANLLVVLDAKRADVYAQVFSSRLEPLGVASAVVPSGLGALVPPGRLVVAGDASGRAVEALVAAGADARCSAAPGVPDAVHVAAIAARRDRPGAADAPPAPLYLRPPDATPAPARRR